MQYANRVDGGVESNGFWGGGGEAGTGRTATDVRRAPEMRGNPKYGRLTPGGQPIRCVDTDTGWTATDIGRIPKMRGNPQYSRPMLGRPSHICGHGSLGV